MPRKQSSIHEQALAIYKKVYGYEHSDVAISLAKLGDAWNKLGDARKAIQFHEQALAIRKKVYGYEHSEVASSLNQIGEVWEVEKDFNKASEFFKLAFEMALRLPNMGEDHPKTMTYKENYEAYLKEFQMNPSSLNMKSGLNTTNRNIDEHISEAVEGRVVTRVTTLY